MADLSAYAREVGAGFQNMLSFEETIAAHQRLDGWVRSSIDLTRKYFPHIERTEKGSMFIAATPAGEEGRYLCEIVSDARRDHFASQAVITVSVSPSAGAGWTPIAQYQLASPAIGPVRNLILDIEKKIDAAERQSIIDKNAALAPYVEAVKAKLQPATQG